MVVENSRGVASDNWARVYAFIHNLITFIDDKITLGRDARLAVIAYNDDSERITSLALAHDRGKLLFLIESLTSNTYSGFSASGMTSALDAASLELQPSIATRLVDWTTREQALIFLAFSPVNNDVAEASMNSLLKLMNALVHVVVVGKKLERHYSY